MRTTNKSLATEPTTQPGLTLELHKFLVLGEILLRAPAAGGPSAAGDQETAAAGDEMRAAAAGGGAGSRRARGGVRRYAATAPHTQ
jgi:hypothetical protein